jgi:N-acyl-D-aspartate/D-glutamate deacylase
MAKVLVRGGTVVDGTGAPARRADVLVDAGRITAVGERLDASGARVLDASGAYVTPGFVDSHTHLDPSMWWDPSCDPMPQHGVTTVLVGNCSLSLAPVNAKTLEEVSDVFCYIEDMPRATFTQGIPWNWETFPEYLAALSGQALAVNAATLVGHSVLRLYVMGDAAWERAATDDERSELARVLDESMAAGAFGFSTSFFDLDENGRRVPSRLADDAEFHALLAVIERRGNGFVEFIPDTGGPTGPAELEHMGQLCGAHGVTGTLNGVVQTELDPDFADRYLRIIRAQRAEGIFMWPQFSPRTIDLRVNWEQTMVFMAMPEGWHRIPTAADDGERERLLRDPEWRAAARAEWDRTGLSMFPVRDPGRIRLIGVTRTELEPWLGQSLADLTAARGGHPSDVLADWVLENDLRPGLLSSGIANSDVAELGRILGDPDTLISSSDAGAHVQMMCAAGDTTLLLTRHVRDRDDLTIEQAVHELTGKQAGVFGFRDRGRVQPGLAGDLAVFALDELHWDGDTYVDDLPTGARRLRRPAGGYRYTMVDGVLTQERGTLTGDRPARVLDVATG